VGLTLFFRETQLKTGHYTLMWSMSKIMRRIAAKVLSKAVESHVVMGTGVQDPWRVWGRHVREHSEETGQAVREFFERTLE